MFVFVQTNGCLMVVYYDVTDHNGDIDEYNLI